MSRRILATAVLLPLALAFNCTPAAFQEHLPDDAKVTFTRTIAENGTFEVAAGDIAYPTSPHGLKALCAVQINATSSPTSSYNFGIFFPKEWNNRFLAVGNGGFSGGINWLDMAAGVGYGFATVSTDAGHNSTSVDAEWAYRDEEARKDFGYRSLHESVEIAKDLVKAYYGEKAEWNYYSGCSTGGRQGLKEVEMFPDDFDGVLAGAPAWWQTHLTIWQLHVGLNNLPTTAEHHIPPTLFPAIEAEVLEQCDPQDGMSDSIISDPEGCNVFPESLLCGANVTNQTTAECLTAPQLSTLYKAYEPYVDVNQTFVFPSFALGSEAMWAALLGSSKPSPYGYEYPEYFLDLGSEWNYTNYDYSLVQLADAKDPGNATADDFDIRPFNEKGGKLITYHGWADGLIPTGSSEYFYKHVLQTVQPRGVELDSFYRHFMVPGMQHCSGTPPDVNAPWYFAGANQAGAIGPQSAPGSLHSVPGFEDREHDVLLALMAWTENETAPERIVATKWVDEEAVGEVARQRPLCPYPMQARYGGQGDPDEAGSWECKAPWAGES